MLGKTSNSEGFACNVSLELECRADELPVFHVKQHSGAVERKCAFGRIERVSRETQEAPRMHSATWKGPDPGWRMKTGRFRTKRHGMRRLAGNDFSNGFVCFGKRLIEIVVLGGTDFFQALE